jgi:hypothetical protein
MKIHSIIKYYQYSGTIKKINYTLQTLEWDDVFARINHFNIVWNEKDKGYLKYKKRMLRKGLYK